MKNDESVINNSIKIKELKSAIKSSKKNFNKNFSHNKFTPLNLLNTFSTKNENPYNLFSEQKKNFDLSNNRLYDKEYINNYQVFNFENNFNKRKKIELITTNSNQNIKNKSSNKKSLTSKKIFKINPDTKFSIKNFKSYLTNKNDFIYNDLSKIENCHINNVISPIEKNNNPETIEIDNYNNIQNFNSYHIYKRSKSTNKFENFPNKEYIDPNSYLNTPISKNEIFDKTVSTDPRNQEKKYNSFIYNPNNFCDLDMFGDSNPVKVVVRFRPMNDVEDVY